MKTICPKCKAQLILNTVSDSEDTHTCKKCYGNLYLPDLLDIEKAEKMLLNPPNWSWVKSKNGQLFIGVRASERLFRIMFAILFLFGLIVLFLLAFLFDLYHKRIFDIILMGG